MHIRLIAVGDRQPAWVNHAFSEYRQRLPRQWQFELVEVAAAFRKGKGRGKAQIAAARRAEGDKILDKIAPSEWAVALDESGRQFTSLSLSEMLEDWQTIGQDVVFVIGGPDGLSKSCLERASLCWSLSKLTLPHGLARVLFIEQIYRSWSLNAGHPYHRE